MGTTTDVVQFARDLGLLVYVTELGDGVRASLFTGAVGTRELHLNIADDSATQRKACAHAISLFWRRGGDLNFGYLVLTDHLNGAGRDPETAAAVRFASALLGPDGGCENCTDWGVETR